MDELVKIAEYTMNYITALRQGLDKFTGMLPVLTEQKIRSLANDKLNTTKQEYLDAVSVKMTDYVLVVELAEDSWLANAVESGADPFSMKSTHLKSAKAKYGKPDKTTGMRYKYLRIPMGKKAGATPGTEKGKALQKKINQVMMKPQFGMARLKTMMDGSVVQSQQVMTSDPDVQGLYRVRQFSSSEEFHTGKRKPQWKLVMFRTMSEKPFGSSWEHPGIKPANIFKETDKWLKANVETMLDTFLSNEVEKLGSL
jgi:hypothetical protein